MQRAAQAISIIIPVGPGRTAATALAALGTAGLADGDEVIVVGDGYVPAIDATITAALPVRCLQTPTRSGANAARNLGAGQAQSGVLAFLDDDDAYLPNALVRVRAAIAAAPEVAAWSLYWRIASGRRQWFARRSVLLSEESIWKRNIAGGCSSLVVRRDALNRLGGFDASLPSMQDWDFWLRLSRIGMIATVREPCVLYYDHGGPRISTNLAARIAGFERLLEKHAPQWPAAVIAFHQSRLAAWRYRAGRGTLLQIFHLRAPVASVLFTLQAMRWGRQIATS